MAKKSTFTERLAEIEEATRPIDAPQITPINEVVASYDAASKTERLVKARAARKIVANPNESKHDKLLRLSNGRVTKACKAINAVGNLAAYKPTPGEVEKIMLALGESCARVSNRLNGIRTESIVFTLN